MNNDDTTNAGALSGLRVLDLSLDIGGMYCTKLLADLGATVLMVEPEGAGHPLRKYGPFKDDRPHPETGGMFLHLCSNKQSISVDLDRPEAAGRLSAHLSNADLVVDTFVPGKLDEIGLGYEQIKRVNPAAVLTSVTHFGQTGPYKDWQGEEIVDYALGGYMYFGGNAEREPLMVPNNQSQMMAGAEAAIASLAAIWWARRTGEGQHVDVSAVEAMLSAHCWTTTSWTHEGVVMRRGEPDCIRCKDGWVFFMGFRWDLNIFLLIDRPELMDDPRFADRQAWIDNRPALLEILAEWCKDHTKQEIFHAGQGLLIPVTPVNTPQDLIESSQLAARNWFKIVEHPIAGSCTLPGFPYHLSETPATIRHPAPSLNQHYGFADDTAKGAEQSIQLRKPIEDVDETLGQLPLTGIRVLEITANWAGPLAGRLLADLGAEVIKIEAPDRPMTRGARYPGGQPFRYHYNRAAYFNKMNRNKYGITIDLAASEGRELYLNLVKESDVVIENNSPRVMRNLDIEYPVLREVNPGIIMVSISGFGQTGPQRDYIAYGANIEASSGLASITGYPDDDTPYRTTLFYADPVTGCHAAVAIQAALMYRATSGKGQFIDMSLDENGISFFPEAVLDYTFAGRLPERLGNRHRTFAPQGCYPSQGDDMWLVLSVRSDEEWGRFCGAVDSPQWADDVRFQTEADRRANHDELDELISSWSAAYDHNEAAAILQQAGIPAAPVLANWEMVSNLHFHERGFYIPVAHPEMGVFPYPGMPWKLSATPGSVRMASPRFGEHNSLIFRDLLKLDEAKMQALYDSRIIADSPPDDLPGPIRIGRL